MAKKREEVVVADHCECGIRRVPTETQCGCGRRLRWENGKILKDQTETKRGLNVLAGMSALATVQ